MNIRRWLLLTGLALMACCLLGATMAGLSSRRLLELRQESRPLVLFHAPLPHDQLILGRGDSVRATARSSAGVRRMELWADGLLLETAEASSPDGDPSLSLRTWWQPETSGPHVLVARAYAENRSPGQASLLVEVVPAPAYAMLSVPEGATLDQLAAASAHTPEELRASNPSLGGGEPLPGDLLVVPASVGEPADGEPSPEADDEPAGVAEDAPPDPAGAPPGSSRDWALALNTELLDAARSWVRPEPVSLRFEALGLETDQPYEGLHCYVAAADLPQRWLPDADGDPSTDESFAPLDGNRWDVAAHLSGAAAPTIEWDTMHALPVEIACVGIGGGGTQAVDLGRLTLAVPPREWDGVTRRATSSGGEGGFGLEYRLGHPGAPRGYPVFLDPSMTRPEALALYPPELTWEYHPRLDEAPIDGFRLYLNGVLQWTEPPDARSTRLPRQWQHPPCDEPYAFTLTAFREAFPDGPESPPSEPVVITPLGRTYVECHPQADVRFRTLTTHELGGDHRSDPGDVGPVHIEVYAGTESVDYSGECPYMYSCIGEGGLDDDSVYDLGTFGFSEGPPSLEVFPDDYDAGTPLEVGYAIRDLDGPLERGEEVCSGRIVIRDLDTPANYAIPSTSGQGRCEVEVEYSLYASGPAVSPGSGPALPFLIIEDLGLHPVTRQLQVSLRNSGAADWVPRDLEIVIDTRDGEPVRTEVFPQLELRAGERTTLTFLGFRPDEPWELCATPNPQGAVREEDAVTPRRVCHPLPDIRIASVFHPEDDLQEAEVTIENRGPGPLVGGAVVLDGWLLEHPEVTFEHEYPDVNLSPTDSMTLALPFDPSFMAGIRAGYFLRLHVANYPSASPGWETREVVP
jgi:hypothetical protein